MKKIKGFVFYQGKSLINGSPILGIATLNSSNSKTGNMIQTWIINDNGSTPLENIKTGADVGICGDCKHRRHTGGACYVDIGRAVMQVYKSYLKGNYPKLPMKKWKNYVENREVRLGAYGDPFAIPYEVWEKLLATAKKYTGYTHQWQRADYDTRINKICMASVDNEPEYIRAKHKKMRTFRVLENEKVNLKPKEFYCPATTEGGNNKQCITCMACSGTGTHNNSNKADVVVVVHGSLKNRFQSAVN